MKIRGLPRTSGQRHVSRETCDDIGAATRELVARWLTESEFVPGDGFLDRIEKLAASVALWGATTNLTANPSDPVELAFHIVDSLAPIACAEDVNRAMLEDALGPDRLAVDLGSGAGFPGLVLAAAFDAHFTLIEARRKRASHLIAAAHAMHLSNVGIEQRRADPLTIEGSFDIATARAFGPLNHLCQAAASALRPGGYLMLYVSAAQLRSSAAVSFERFEAPLSWTYSLDHSGHLVERAVMLLRKTGIRSHRS